MANPPSGRNPRTPAPLDPARVQTLVTLLLSLPETVSLSETVADSCGKDVPGLHALNAAVQADASGTLDFVKLHERWTRQRHAERQGQDHRTSPQPRQTWTQWLTELVQLAFACAWRLVAILVFIALFLGWMGVRFPTSGTTPQRKDLPSASTVYGDTPVDASASPAVAPRTAAPLEPAPLPDDGRMPFSSKSSKPANPRSQ